MMTLQELRKQFCRESEARQSLPLGLAAWAAMSLPATCGCVHTTPRANGVKRRIGATPSASKS
jgi:hypothetical protein